MRLVMEIHPTQARHTKRGRISYPPPASVYADSPPPRLCKRTIFVSIRIIRPLYKMIWRVILQRRLGIVRNAPCILTIGSAFFFVTLFYLDIGTFCRFQVFWIVSYNNTSPSIFVSYGHIRTVLFGQSFWNIANIFIFRTVVNGIVSIFWQFCF